MYLIVCTYTTVTTVFSSSAWCLLALALRWSYGTIENDLDIFHTRPRGRSISVHSDRAAHHALLLLLSPRVVNIARYRFKSSL